MSENNADFHTWQPESPFKKSAGKWSVRGSYSGSLGCLPDASFRFLLSEHKDVNT